MSTDLILQRLLTYQCQTILEQEHALKEIAQEIALMILSRTGFFRVAAFQGGTCLRILYGLDRFSEDLDFTLLEPNPQFNWQTYLEAMKEEFSAYGYLLDIKSRVDLEKNVKIAFLKAESAGALLTITDANTQKTKLKIKLEIDTNPPAGSSYETKYLDFPLAYSVNAQDFPSLFAGKCHALLCREYTKGRDWYDFSWYVARGAQINWSWLQSALEQSGPWQGKSPQVNAEWLIEALTNKIITLDWDAAKKDVARFLKPKELTQLELWSSEFFLSRVEKLAKSLRV